MALQEQPIDVAIQAMNQQAPQSAGPIGRLKRITNGIAKQFVPGRLRVSKRPGFQPLSSTVRHENISVLPNGAQWLADFRGQLVGQFQSFPYAYSATDGAWQGFQTSSTARPAISPHTLSKLPLINANTRTSTPDTAAVGNRLMSVWRENNGTGSGTSTTWMMITDAVAGVVVLQPIGVAITDTFTVKVVSDGAQFWVFSQATAQTSTVVQVFSTNGTQLATSTISWSGTPRGNWDVRYASGIGQVVLATPVGGGTTDVRFMTYAAATITTNVHTTPAADCTLGLGFLDNTAGTNVFFAGTDASNHIRGFQVSSAGALTHTFVVDTSNASTIGEITGFVQYNAGSPSYIVVVYSTSGLTYNLATTTICDTSNATTSRVLRGLICASRAYADAYGNYYAVMWYQGTAVVGNSVSYPVGDVSRLNAQPSYFVTMFSVTNNLVPVVVGQFEYGSAAMFAGSVNSMDSQPFGLASVAQDLTGVKHVPLGYLGVQTIVPATGGEFVALTGINDYRLTPSPGRPVSTTDELLIPGLQGTRFDGTVFVDDGFQLRPEAVTYAPASGGSMTVGEAYFYVGVYEWLDNNGNVVQSMPSLPMAPAVLTAGQGKYSTTWTTMRTSNKVGIRISIYRTFSPTLTGTTAGTILNKVGELANDPTVDTVSFTDSVSDTDASLGEPLYTQPLNLAAPRALEYFPTPAFTKGCTADGRTFVIGWDSAIWFSEQRVEGFGAPFNPELRITLPTTANPLNLLPMDARMVVLCDDGTSWTFPIQGLPNDTLTTGSIPQPEVMPSTTGSTGAALMTPQGAFYGAEHGPWLLDRGLNDSFIGAPVQDEIAGFENIQVTDINVDRQQRVYFTLGVDGAPGSSSEILAWDLISQCWYIWEAPGVPSCAASWAGSYVFADDSVTPPLVWVLDDDSASGHLDNGAGIISSYEFAPMSFAGVNGYESCWQTQFYGQFEGPHRLSVDIKYDESDTVAQTFAFNVLTDPGVYRYEFMPTQVDCQSIALVFTDSFPGGVGPGDSFALEALGFLVGVERGLGRLPPTTNRIAP